MKAKRAKEGDWALAKRIQFCRNLQGASQTQIANLTGLERSVYAKIESGLRTVSAMELEKIAKALWVDMLDLLKPQELESAIPLVMVCGDCDPASV